MPKITRVTGPWTDGAPLPADNINKDHFHFGRQAGFDGTKGGLEIINGQLDFDGNFDVNGDGSGDDTISSRHVRRGTFIQGPHVSGFRQSRDVWYRNFPDLNALGTPEMYQQARPVLGKTWENLTLVDSILFDITVDYTVASNQNFRNNASEEGEPAITANPPFRAFMGVWINGYLYEPSATPLVAGRSSTVEPYFQDEVQYFNQGVAPDFRTFSMKIRMTAEDAAPGTDWAGLLAPGWRNVSVRVSGRQTMRIHGGSIIVTPIR